MLGSNTAALGEPEVKRLLTEESLVRLGYLTADGFPTVVPTGFLWKDGAVVICTAPTAAKVEAIRRNPRVALEIEGGNGAEQLLLMRGEATIDVVEGVASEYLAASRKSMAGAEADQFEAQVRAVYSQMARIAITPRWVRYYDFPGGRLPPFLAALVERATP